MSGYPFEPAAGRTDTSAEAARAIAPGARKLQGLALDAIRTAGSAGLTAEELARTLRLDRAAIQPRTTELRSLGRIRDSGMRRQNASGKRAIVWVAA